MPEHVTGGGTQSLAAAFPGWNTDTTVPATERVRWVQGTFSVTGGTSASSEAVLYVSDSGGVNRRAAECVVGATGANVRRAFCVPVLSGRVYRFERTVASGGAVDTPPHYNTLSS